MELTKFSASETEELTWFTHLTK